jgi:hypothetical protein
VLVEVDVSVAGADEPAAGALALLSGDFAGVVSLPPHATRVPTSAMAAKSTTTPMFFMIFSLLQSVLANGRARPARYALVSPEPSIVGAPRGRRSAGGLCSISQVGANSETLFFTLLR